MAAVDDGLPSLSVDEDSDNELDWEEVEVPQRHLEITLKARPKQDPAKSVLFPTFMASADFRRYFRKKGTSHAERVARINCHKIHTVALLANAAVRNKWINDPLLHVGRNTVPYAHIHTAIGSYSVPDPVAFTKCVRYDPQVSHSGPTQARTHV